MKIAITFERFYIDQGDNPKGVTAHNAWQHQQAKIDELQARIDKTVNHIEEWYGCVELSNIVDMLKGNEDEN